MAQTELPFILVPDPNLTRFNGAALARLRKAKGYTPTKFSALIGRSSVALWRYEAGASCPTPEVVNQMVTALDCDLADLYELRDGAA